MFSRLQEQLKQRAQMKEDGIEEGIWMPSVRKITLPMELKYGKTAKKKEQATCLATLLQDELNSDGARFTTHRKLVLQQIRLLTGLNVGDKTRKIAF